MGIGVKRGMEKNRKWIRLFLIFLAVMWLFTIISKSIYVSGLTRVKTDVLSRKYIEHIVEADGIVLAGGEAAVNVLAGLRVESISVQKGDAVKAGDVLFTVDLRDLEEQIADKQKQIARLELQLGTAQFNEVLDAQKREVSRLWAKEDYDNADKETQLAVDRAQSALLDEENDLRKHMDTSAPHTSGSSRKKAWEKYNDWKKRCYALEDRIAELEKEIQRLKDEIADASGEDAQAANEGNVSASGEGVRVVNEENVGTSGEDAQVQEDLEHAKTEETGMEGAETGNADKKRAETGEDISDKQAQLAEKESELEACKAELTELERNPVSQPDYSAEESEYDAWQQTKSNLEDAVQAAKHALEDAKLARESTLREKRRALASAEVTASADATIGIYNMDIAALQGEIADLNDVKSSQGCVTAKADGYVLEILVATGQRTTDTAAMLLADTTSEYLFRFGITKEQSKYVQLGDSVELSLNSANHKKVTVTADYIEENTAGGYDVTCRLGDAKAPIGSYGVAKRTVQGEMYPSAVPIDAILEENKVYYLFTVNEKTGILGKEYYVERLKVNVVDQNDRYAAIEGAAIGADMQIVIFSSKELKQGESVRLEE